MSSQPPGQVLLSDDDRGPGILAVSWVECIVALIFVTARMYCRQWLLRSVGRDDWSIVFSWILAFITTIFVTLEVHFGVGRHIVFLDPNNVTAAIKIIWMTQPFSTFSACFGKISIAFLLMRLMNRNKVQERILCFMIVTLLLINLLCTIITFAQCTPVWQLWQGPHPNPYCWDPRVQQDVGYAQAAYSAFTDLALAIFPYFIIRGLQMKTKVKIGLLFLLSLGILATAAAIVKTIELKNLTSPDFTWDATNLAYWFMTENYVIIIAACIPTLRPLFQKRPSNQAPSSSRRAKKNYFYYGSARSEERSNKRSGDVIPLQSVDSTSHHL